MIDSLYRIRDAMIKHAQIVMVTQHLTDQFARKSSSLLTDVYTYT